VKLYLTAFVNSCITIQAVHQQINNLQIVVLKLIKETDQFIKFVNIC